MCGHRRITEAINFSFLGLRTQLARTRKAELYGFFAFGLHINRTPHDSKRRAVAGVEEKTVRLLARRRENFDRVSQEQANR